MIINRMKECCENCNFIDAHVKTDYMCRGRETPHTVIWCEHMHVCGDYRDTINKDNAPGRFAKMVENKGV